MQQHTDSCSYDPCQNMCNQNKNTLSATWVAKCKTIANLHEDKIFTKAKIKTKLTVKKKKKVLMC